ncbi:hypothetical protein CTI12_AA399460 [Artemisia annua]|uniref:Uncharacterized protein n=1 Tax=Artemisia annua TaxID=35608 RepID=A0A2U1LFE9_ARTAN|nr:hypothetical protein CTI12_AA399460 [Artemisia annua]
MEPTLPVLPRLDRLDRLRNTTQSKRFGSITANNDDDNDDNVYKEMTVNHLSCKTLSSALDDVHQKGTLIDRVAMLENRVLQYVLWPQSFYHPEAVHFLIVDSEKVLEMALLCVSAAQSSNNQSVL